MKKSFVGMATILNPQDITVDTIPLRDHSEILPRLQERREIRESMYHSSSETRCHKLDMKTVLKYLIIFLIVVGAILAYTLTQTKQDRTLESLVTATAEKSKDDPGYNIEIEIGSRHAYQHCKGPHFKQAFPDIDYALFGYNVLKGFPFSNGHDPGFTYPIFFADYSSGRLSADCRFFVPNGLVVAPDISCMLSLSSKTVQSQYEFSEALEVYTSIEGEYSPSSKVGKGGKVSNVAPKVVSKKTGERGSSWGLSFSASVGYRQTSSKISSGKSVYVYSTAKCKYYYSKLVRENAPKFDDGFMKSIYKLDKAGLDPEKYFNFFDIYGTHFATEVTFGARYTYEHRMSYKFYESLRERGVDVDLMASYTGKKSLSGNLSVSYEQRKLAAEISDNVKTKIIPVGASPPEDGNALTWASQVQTNPIPTEYKLSSIENLFTDEYMNHLNIDYQKIHYNIINMKLQYCLFLQSAGKLESCESLGAGVVLENTKLLGHYQEVAVVSLAGCIDTCLQEFHCHAITYCMSCLSKDNGYKKCYLVKGTSNSTSAVQTEEPNTIWQSNIFPEKMNAQMKLSNVSITGAERALENEDNKNADLLKCKDMCIVDAYCSAYSFSNSSETVPRCKMYTKELITGLQTKAETDTFFIAGHTEDLSESG
ncbi:uncharacterized protein LOC123559990 [Mercenaria mercenaria]|uniref:uncharacterized protein LOC123559990 n=1 Tax=Mercenaria mercenaria TaxID=6596 RepID=UPI00234F290C|nr:uncharacterized protein LOC123559990 [Mercenaria mercenaria]